MHARTGGAIAALVLQDVVRAFTLDFLRHSLILVTSVYRHAVQDDGSEAGNTFEF